MSDFVDSLGEDLMADSAQVEDAPATTPTPEPEPQQDPQPETQPEPEHPQGHVPFGAVLDERDKRKAAEQRAEALERQIQQIQQSQAPQTRPDLYDDPDAFAAHLQQQQADALFRTTAQVSARFAAKEHGEDTLKSAVDWAGQKNDQYLHQRFMSSDDPYGLLVTEFKRDQLLSKFGNDPDAYVRQRFAELSIGSQTTQPGAQAPITQPSAQRPTARPSLASMQGAGEGPTIAETAFSEMKFALDR